MQQIPIQNIYYLLCYAWNKLEEKERVNVAVDDQTELVDLFAKVLLSATRILLKRGLEQTYLGTVQEIAGVKGKLDLSQTLKRNQLPRLQTTCQFDEFSPDVLTNQILHGTLRKLLKTSLKPELKVEIKKLLPMFPPLSPIRITEASFKQVRYHRKNRFYQFPLHVCQLIHESLLPQEETGNYNFMDFRRDERKMNQLFEAFLFNFYQIEQRRYKVSREIIQWKLEAPNEEHRQFIPVMKTDITLQSPEEKIIIDAKYYGQTMAEHYDRSKIHSGNLYQLFSYLINQEGEEEKTKKATGILIYPKIKEAYDLHYKFASHKIRILTIDLNCHWCEIKNSLLKEVEVD